MNKLERRYRRATYVLPGNNVRTTDLTAASGTTLPSMCTRGTTVAKTAATTRRVQSVGGSGSVFVRTRPDGNEK
jgi:hypothetical protein